MDYRIEIQDTEGFNIGGCPHETTNIKEARKWCKDAISNRTQWVEHAEQETFPDGIFAFAIKSNEEVIEEFFPKWQQPMTKPCQHLTGYWINKANQTFRCYSCQFQFIKSEIPKIKGRKIEVWKK